MLSELKKFSRPTIGLICVFSVVLVGWILPPILWPGGIGIGKDESVTTTTVETIEKDKQGKTVKKVTTTAHNDGKTLWDWGSLLGVPLSLAILGYFLQQQQQKRAEKLSKEQEESAKKFAEEQRRIADNETKEEVLQTYFDRLSVLLIDKNLIALSNKYKGDVRVVNSEERERLDSSLDVIRARTLSILRRFENDTERKTSVIQFLIETELVSKSNLDLSGANLAGMDFFNANLANAQLHETNLTQTDLLFANLTKAFLFKANLSYARLSCANLTKADLTEADLTGARSQGTKLIKATLTNATLIKVSFIKAKLIEADLTRADLTLANLFEADLTDADLTLANLSGAYFYKADFSGANLTKTKLYKANFKDIKWNSKTVWPDKSQFDNAENIPEELKKELDITP